VLNVHDRPASAESKGYWLLRCEARLEYNDFFEAGSSIMQHARTTLNKLFSDAVRREADGGAVSAWPLACGSRIAERTTALSFADGVLTVAVPDEAWRHQLQTFIPQYLAALNRMVAEPVRELQFRIVQRQR
jgi:predicted nucleic acid-binding Zn ribbon protein